MTTRDVAKRLNVSIRCIGRLREHGRLPPAIKLSLGPSGGIRWDRRDIERWIDEQRQTPLESDQQGF